MFVEGTEHQDELEVDGVPPYEEVTPNIVQ